MHCVQSMEKKIGSWEITACSQKRVQVMENQAHSSPRKVLYSQTGNQALRETTPNGFPNSSTQKAAVPNRRLRLRYPTLRKKYCHETGGKARAERKPLRFFSGKPLRKTFWISRHRSGPAFCSISFKATQLC